MAAESTSPDLLFPVHIQPEYTSGLTTGSSALFPSKFEDPEECVHFPKILLIVLVISRAGPLHDSLQASCLFSSWQCHYEAPQLTIQAQLI